MAQKITNAIRTNQIIQAILFVLALFVLHELKSLILSLFVAFILASTFSPIVTFLEARRVPRALALSVPYLLSLLIFVLVVLPLIPFLSTQAQALFNNFPRYVDSVGTLLGAPIQLSDIQAIAAAEVDAISHNILTTSRRIFGGFFTLLSTVVISFYLLADFKNIDDKMAKLFPKEIQPRARIALDEAKIKLGQWIRGQVVLSLAVGILTFIFLTAFQIPYAFVLALIAGLLEVIPTIGPIVSAVPAVIIALSESPTKALMVVLIYIVVQLLENNILVPRIMEKAVGLRPLTVLLGVIIGAQLFGIPGALLSIPFLAAATTIWSNFKKTTQESDN